MQKILDSLSEHVVYHDMEMKVLWANRAACQSVKLELEQLAGRHCYEIWAQRPTPCDDCPVTLARKTGQPQSVEKRTPDGRYWYLRCTPILDANGKLEATIEFALDISERKKMEAALKKSEMRHRCLVETSPHAIQENDLRGIITFANPAHHRIYGYSDQEMVGKSIIELQRCDIARAELERYFARLVEEQPEPTPYIGKNYTKDGRVIDVQVDWNYKRDDQGRVTGFISVVTDITDKIRAEAALLQAKTKLEQRVQERTAALLEANARLSQEIGVRKQSEQALEKSESTLKAILSASPVGICLVRNRILEWTNLAMYRIWGYEMDSLLGQNTRVLYSSIEEYERIGQEFYTAIEQFGIGRAETQWVKKEGEEIYCYLQGCLLDPLDASKGTIVAAMDITQRKQTEDLVRELSHMLIESQENERKMISYELHDSIAQNLSYLKINCDTFFDKKSDVSDELKEKMGNQSKLIGQAIDAVRGLSYGLHPPSLDQLGITQTIFQLCNEFSDNTGIGVDFVPTGVETFEHDPLLGINIYRLIQEGLNNIRKHADANHVKIVLVASHPNLILSIQDDGKGFNFKAREAEFFEPKCMGLRSMTERVNLLQGTLKIKSRPKQGTNIFIKIPSTQEITNGESEKRYHHYR